MKLLDRLMARLGYVRSDTTYMIRLEDGISALVSHTEEMRTELHREFANVHVFNRLDEIEDATHKAVRAVFRKFKDECR